MKAARPAPPAFLRLTGHPIRWQLLAELARSDRQVRELTGLVGERQSLTSYHLRQLREGGLVTVRRSSADGRDSYYSLDLPTCRRLVVEAGAALHGGLRLVPEDPTPPTAGAPARVLFLCTGNSARSQMAEAILAHLGGPRVWVVSAGSAPKDLHPAAVRVLAARGIDIADRRSKHLDTYAGQPFDHVISLCDRVREVCPEFPGGPEVAHWSLPDPAAEPAAADDVPFERTADLLTTRIEFLLASLAQRPPTPEGPTP